MALSFSLCLVLNDDCSVFTIQDNTVYGSPNQNRNATGNVLVTELIDSCDRETFITVDSTPYDSKISYDINNSADGHYHNELLLFLNYNGSTTYNPETRDINNIIVTYANLIYYPTTQKFYKNILTCTGIAPDAMNGSTYWQQITDFTNPEVRQNTTIQIAIFDALANCRGIKCTKDALISLIPKIPGCVDVKTLLPYLKKKVLLGGAKAEADSNNFEKAQSITETLANLCPCQTC